MGSFKPLLPISGQAAIIHVINAFIKAGIDDIKIVTGHKGNDIKQALTDYPVKIVHNPDYAKGMYTSVQKGVAAISENCEAFFILPVDYPLVKYQTIKKLAQFWSNIDKKNYLPCFRGGKRSPAFNFDGFDT